MKKYILALLPLVMLGACKKDFEKLNTNPKLFPTVPAATLVTQAERQLSSAVTTSSVNNNVFRLVEQQWQETTYNDESLYNFDTRNINKQMWNSLYRDVLNNLQLAKGIIPTDQSFATDAAKANSIAIVDLLQVYSFYYLVTTFGDCPYTQAFDPKNNFPKYDDAATIYKDLLKRVDADIAALNGTVSFGTADIIYGGSVAKWKKFAYSFKLKMGMTIADYDAALAKTTVAAAAGSGAANVFSANADNATFAYLSATPNTNPIWVDIIQSGRFDYVACKTIADALNLNKDGRASKYFKALDASGNVLGADPGSKANYDSFSHVSDIVTATTAPGLLLDNAEIQFYLAEAAQKGFITGDAATYYAAGVNASFDYWTATGAAAYLVANPYNATNLANQKWLANYNRGWDAWIETRRLDAPVLHKPATGAFSEFPVRFKYPVDEANTNGTNYKAASAAIGGDVVTTKLFFDKTDMPK
ncbi:SusD/RagB family nutrient-binding outer membrane lipoprotein [Mucilaginibacter aquaedulcis]|uniref:SusD/RagB family nutrient-binding outer membrane lipoprotein n=1 Tax=Mucilaginibacter aquaedulcis TaxID=1187081 RepID=UPI0025B49C6D|nr:SusD/RagB family nutrient-binding outer membrane lipoprotein [Mucilaginibacter aquaedulcis]MDN3550701.1 SusD/RagB family nutrient-binding outer membrane lipoprotein [Mucilaginibacter aquaedulcis]